MNKDAWFKLFISCVLICAIFVIFIIVWPGSVDYFFTFRPVTMAFIRGDTLLYDKHSIGFYNAPWTVFLFLPTVLLPFHYGQSLWLTFSLLGILVSILAVSEEKNRVNLLAIILALSNLHTFDLILRGNVDGVLALGVGLGWLGIRKKKPLLLGMGLWLLSIKPINVVLVILIFAKALTGWPTKDKILSALPLLASVALSFPLFGKDWLVRYIHSIKAHPPLTYLQTSLWRMLEYFGIQRQNSIWLFLLVILGFSIVLIRTKTIDKYVLAIAISTNLFFSPYTLGSHYVLLAPVFIILTEKYRVFFLAWLLTFTPLLRLYLGFGYAWIDIVYPFTLMVGASCLFLQNKMRANHAFTRPAFGGR